MLDNNVLEFRHITKQYPGVTALDDVSIDIRQGEIHALMGENGAGKSTLIKVLSGAVIPDGGEIVLNGEGYSYMTPAMARKLGIGVIYQEFNLMPALSVAENVLVGSLPGGKITINREEMNRRTNEIFETMQVHIDPNVRVGSLSVAYMQMVEIAKALSQNAKILVMDEPTAPLTTDEVNFLFSIVKNLHEQGVTIIYISHRINEIFRIADRVTVMRDGKKIVVDDTKNFTKARLIQSMVGREISDAYPKRTNKLGEVELEVKSLTGIGARNISFSVHKGEVLGLAGLVGAGRTETARMIFGADQKTGGTILLEGEEVKLERPSDAVRLGIGLIPEDRKRQGVIGAIPLSWNTTMTILPQISHATVIDSNKERGIVKGLIEAIRIKTPSMIQLVRNLSGGNQQKVVLAKWLAANCKVLLFDEPTRGIDVGAKQEIYRLINELCEKGLAVIMISSDMEEILGMADRIVVLSEGNQAGILEKEAFSQETILSLASGVR